MAEDPIQSEPEITAILACFPAATDASATPLGSAGGFSGARLWRLQTPHGWLCLRRWPREHPDRQRLAYIHRVLRHVVDQGFAKLPLPLSAGDGNSIVGAGGYLWQLEPWIEGQADFHAQPNDNKLAAAMRALAAFHLSASSFETASGPAPGIVQRREQFEQLTDAHLQRLAAGLASLDWAEFRSRGEQVLRSFDRLAPAAHSLVSAAEQTRVTVHPCIRDIWHDNVLFVGDEVSGFVDFGALRLDHVAADISRLLGSLVGDDARRRAAALAAYEAVRPLRAEDNLLIEAYDRSSTLLSGINWIEWICLDRRRFENPQRVLGRLDQILARLPAAV